MTDMITLREYLDELGDLLENESPTEVASHCRHILQHYPQNVETYRLLGKALLQRGHHEGQKDYFDEAAEVFLRVLSALPNDPVAHLGLSEIRERENALDQAIWHLERAHEELPGNAVIQEALRDLYAKRDGADNVPDKIQLTRSALARQFANNKQYEQALVELREAIAHAPQRVDLKVLLAEALWESGHTVEAGEMAVEVLKKLPNSIAAHKILVQLWLDYDRPTDAQVFLNQLDNLDPYEASRLVQPEGNIPDLNRLSRLDYAAQATAELSTETPAWVQDLDDFGEDGARMEDLFLAPTDSVLSDSASIGGPDRIDTEAVFGTSFNAEDQSDWLAQAASDASLPDWFSPTDGDADMDTEEPETPLSPDEGSAWESSGTVDEFGDSGTIPDWFAEVTSVQPADPASMESDWLAVSDEMAKDEDEFTLVDEGSIAEGGTEALAADWLMDGDGIGEPLDLGAQEKDRTALDDLTPDWLIPEEQTEGVREPFLPWDAQLGEETASDAAPDDWLTDYTQIGATLDAFPSADGEQSLGSDEKSLGDWLTAGAEEIGEAIPSPEMLSEDWLAELDKDGAQLDSETQGDTLSALGDLMPDWLDQDNLEQTAEDVARSSLDAVSDEISAPELASFEWTTEQEKVDAALDAFLGGAVEKARDHDVSEDDWPESLDLIDEVQPVEAVSVPDWHAEEAYAEATLDTGVPDRELDATDSTGDSEADWLAGLREISDEKMIQVADEGHGADTEAPVDGTVSNEAVVEDNALSQEPDMWHDIEDAGEDDDSAFVAEEFEKDASDWLTSPEGDVQAVSADVLPDGVGANLDGAEFVEHEATLPDAEPGLFEMVEHGDDVETDQLPTLGDDLPADGMLLHDHDAKTVADGAAEGDYNDIEALRRASMPPPDLDLVTFLDDSEDSVGVTAEEDADLPPEWMTEPEYDFFAPTTEAETVDDSTAVDAVGEDLDGARVADALDLGVKVDHDELAWLDAGAENIENDWLSSFSVGPAETYSEAELNDVVAQLEEASKWSESDQAEDETYSYVTDDVEAESLGEVGEGQPLGELVEDKIPATAEPLEQPIDTGDIFEAWDDLDKPQDAVPEAVAGVPDVSSEPAWLAEIEPIETSDMDALDEDRDSTVELEDVDYLSEDTQYHAGRESGVIQTGELPDWMTIFTGESMPEDNLRDEAALGTDEVVSFTSDVEEDEVTEPEFLAEDLDELMRDEASSAALASAVADEVDYADDYEDMDAEVGDGVMPEWLMTITSSEAEKYDDMLRDELDSYSLPTDEAAVFEPASEPDWLLDEVSEMKGGEVEPDDEDPRLSEVAQPDDMAHTTWAEAPVEVVDTEAAVSDEIDFDEGEGDEVVPEHFSFHDRLPAWLRRPKESDLESSQQVSQDRASEMPEWLRDVIEDDDDSVE